MNMELSATPSVHPMDLLLAEDFNLTIPVVGETIKGIVVAHNENGILVDIGAKSEGMISTRELDTLDPDARERLEIGSEVPVYVISIEDQSGNIVLSFGQAVIEEGWSLAQDLLETQDNYSVKITGYNKGGLLTKVGNVRAFVPTSQLGGPPPAGASLDDYLKQFIGQTLDVKVIEVERPRNRLILSARDAAKKLRDKQRYKLLGDLQEGDICDGTVVNIERFGAFVDIGGIQGLVHLSELSWTRIAKPADIVTLGQRLKVYVLSVENDKQRVALSIKRLTTDPWDDINEIYHEGQLVEVTITKLERYGAFARLNDQYGLEGLIHISELADERVKSAGDIVQEGDVVMVRVIRVDADQRQLGLSIKQVSSAKYQDFDLANLENNETLTADSENED
ncbi:MAG: S1 RNA-binding domain-containing protein [Chloroflexi bacterium]|nr:S1 RNA-binding domain-containing protein [Chloroflexota bacterium]MDA0242236.1 S1 RNA-binding domain-containing protein [Chloroflexota bacterium]